MVFEKSVKCNFEGGSEKQQSYPCLKRSVFCSCDLQRKREMEGGKGAVTQTPWHVTCKFFYSLNWWVGWDLYGSIWLLGKQSSWGDIKERKFNGWTLYYRRKVLKQEEMEAWAADWNDWDFSSWAWQRRWAGGQSMLRWQKYQRTSLRKKWRICFCVSSLSSEQ